MTRILLSEIGYDPKFYPRVNGDSDWLTVHRYSDALTADEKYDFDPVVVVKTVGRNWPYLLIDGRHRCKSYTQAGREDIPAIVERLPESRWFARSVELNAKHGRPLDSGDKAWIAKRLEADGYSEEDVAKLLCMRVESLQKIKVEHVVKITSKEGKLRPIGRSHREIETGGKTLDYGFLKAPFKEMAGTASAESALAVQAPLSSSGVVNVLDSAIAVIECGVDESDPDVGSRMARLRALLQSEETGD